MTGPRSSRGVLLVIAALLFWSSGGPLVRACGLGWAGYIFVANVVGQGILFAMSPRRIVAGLRAMPPRLFAALAGSLTLNATTLFMAFEKAPITVVNLTHYTAPVLIAVLAPHVLGEPRAKRTPIALGLALAGLFAIQLDPTRAALGGEAAVASVREGTFLALLSALGYTGLVLSTRAAARAGHSGETLAAAISLPLTVLVVPFVAWEQFTPRGVALAAFAGILHIPLASVLYCKGLAVLTAETVGILGYLEVLFADVWAKALYGEPTTPAVLLGAVLIFSGGALALWPASRASSPHRSR